MKFQPDLLSGVNRITRQEPGRIWVGSTAFGNTAFDASVVVPWVGPLQPWQAATVAELTPAHFERLAQGPASAQPEVVIFGSGNRIRFVPPALLRALFDKRIGVETMDTPAACRTYNVLASEGRRVLAALLIEPPA